MENYSAGSCLGATGHLFGVVVRGSGANDCTRLYWEREGRGEIGCGSQGGLPGYCDVNTQSGRGIDGLLYAFTSWKVLIALAESYRSGFQVFKLSIHECRISTANLFLFCVLK